MDDTTILKLIDFIKGEDKAQALELLQKELIKNDSKQSTSVYTAIKNYLKKAGKDRPQSGMIQIHSDGTKSIINGYSMVIFKSNIKEIDTIDVVDSEINYKVIYPKNTTQDDDFKNSKMKIAQIKKFKTYCKAREIAGYIPFNLDCYDVNLLIELCDIMQLHKKEFTINFQDNTKNNIMCIETDTMQAILLPIRHDKDVIQFHSTIWDDFKQARADSVL